MAGTRLAIQTTVLVELLVLIWVSVYYGFCRNGCKRGNLTKDLPLVPGLRKRGGGATTENGAVVEAQFWEEIVETLVCVPIHSVFGAFLTTTPTDATTIVADEIIPEEDLWWYNMVSSTKLEMTLVVENVTELPLWIELLSKELRDDDNNKDEECDGNDNGNDDEDKCLHRSTFSTLLHKNPMGLEIVPPLESLADEDNNSDDSIDPSVVLTHYKRHSGSFAEATLLPTEREQKQQRKLVVYIPASMVIVPEETETIGWRAFDTKPSGAESTRTIVSSTVTTMVLPTSTGISVASSELQPLVEDWMARSIQEQQQDDPVRNKHRNTKSSNNDDDESKNPTKKIRLTREFSMEHFLAVTMPLIFPLLLPFLVSWIKEFKRYKTLTKTKKERLEKAANETKTSGSAASPSSKIKDE